MLQRLFLCLVSGLLSLGLTASEGQRWSHSTRVNVGDQGVLNSCDQIDIRFDGAQMFRTEETRSISKSAAPKLVITDFRNGGIHVQGSDVNEYVVTACKAAGAVSVAGAKAIVDQISLSIRDGRVSIAGASDDDWIVYLIVQAPRGGVLDLETRNGPIGLRGFSGRAVARTTNGPISLKNCAGDIDAAAENGPINVAGEEGNLRVRTQNGPIGVKLTGRAWRGAGLEARAENGPLKLQLPEDYSSGVQVDMSFHAPFRCRSTRCGEALKDWNDDLRRLKFGSEQPVVRMSTVNGPVTIDSPSRD